MNMKKSFKRFWTMQKSTGGFTLVELIVVIAILAILAGIGIPAYSGYITKANEAADRQLLATVNRAFIAACNQQGINQLDIDSAELNIDGEGHVGTAPAARATGDTVYFAKVIYGAEDIAAEMNEAFAIFFAGNENAVFKSFNCPTTLKLNALGVFGLPGDNGPTKEVTINGKVYYVSQQAIEDFKAATVFSENVEQMQEQVDVLSSAYGGLIYPMLQGGILDESALAEAFGPEYAAYLTAAGAESGAEIGNATVLFVANKSANLTAQDAMETLCDAAFFMQKAQQEGKQPTLMDVLGAADATGDPLSTAALMYGAVVAYANGGDGTDPSRVALKEKAEAVNDGVSLLELFQKAAADSKFTGYCGSYKADANVGVTEVKPSDEFIRDMNGYLGAMNGLDAVSGEIDISAENPWSSEYVDKILNDMTAE